MLPWVAYIMSSGATRCFNAAHLGAIRPLNFTGDAASTFGHLTLVSVLVFFTCNNGFHLHNSVNVSVILVFVYSVGLHWSSHNALSSRVSGVSQGPCFRCGFSF